MLSKLPNPLGKTTSVDKCGEAFVKGIEGRKRRVNVPGWVGAFRWLRPVLSTPVGERPITAMVPDHPAEDGRRGGRAGTLDEFAAGRARDEVTRYSATVS